MNDSLYELLSPEEFHKLNMVIDSDDEIESISIVMKTKNYYYVKKSKKAYPYKK